MLTRRCWSCCSRGQTPLNRRKSAAPEMLLGENDDEKEKENLRTQVCSRPEFLETLSMVPLYSKGTRPLTFENFMGQNADTPTAPSANSFTPFKKMLDRWECCSCCPCRAKTCRAAQMQALLANWCR